MSISAAEINLDDGRAASEWAASGSLKNVFLPALVPEQANLRIYEEMEGALRGKRDLQPTRSYAHRNVYKKMGTQDFTKFEYLSSYMNYFISEDFVGRLRKVTGIEDIHADPLFFGGGIAEMAPGAYLKNHRDFNQHSTTGQYRRLNLLVYVNPRWLPEWGGGIELWDETNRKRLAEFFGANGDAVLFETSEISYHGVPAIRRDCPVARRTLALYYFSNTWPDANIPVRVRTDYQLTPVQWVDLIERIWDDAVEGLGPDQAVANINKRQPDPYLFQGTDVRVALKELTDFFSRYPSARTPLDKGANPYFVVFRRMAGAIEGGTAAQSAHDDMTRDIRDKLVAIRSDVTHGDVYRQQEYP